MQSPRCRLRRSSKSVDGTIPGRCDASTTASAICHDGVLFQCSVHPALAGGLDRDCSTGWRRLGGAPDRAALPRTGTWSSAVRIPAGCGRFIRLVNAAMISVTVISHSARLPGHVRSGGDDVRFAHHSQASGSHRQPAPRGHRRDNSRGDRPDDRPHRPPFGRCLFPGSTQQQTIRQTLNYQSALNSGG